MASTDIQTYISQFSDDIRDLVEQSYSKLRPAVDIEMADGQKHFFNRLGSLNVSSRSGRNEPIDLDDAAHSRRMATLGFYDLATTLDPIDDLQRSLELSAPYARKHASAHARNLDDVIIAAALGTAATGATGTGTQAFDSNQQVAHGTTGFTVAKFNSAMQLLEANEVDIENVPLVLLLGSLGVQDLLGESNYTSFDFSESKPLGGRRLPQFRGVNIIRTQRIPDETANSVYRGILMTTDTIKVAMAQDMKVTISKRNDLKGHPDQIYTEMSFGAVRMEEATIVDALYQ